GGRWSAHRPPSGALPPGARRRRCAPDILGHLKHHLRLHCPHELWMVVCEVSLHRIEELLIGLSCESRPALAVGDPPVPFVDRGHMSWSLRSCWASLRPADDVDGWPRSTLGKMSVPRWRY